MTIALFRLSLCFLALSLTALATAGGRFLTVIAFTDTSS
jgi:hypothetical protein